MENFNKLRNIGIGVAATVASIVGFPEKANSSGVDNKETTTELVNEINILDNYENNEENVDGEEINSFKELKNIIKDFDYENIPGSLSIDMIEKILNEGISKGNKYFISTSIGQTQIGANMTAMEQLKIRNHGYLLRKYTFYKNLPNKSIKILVLAEYK